jgi:hypothetical protein
LLAAHDRVDDRVIDMEVLPPCRKFVYGAEHGALRNVGRVFGALGARLYEF